jgi:DNA polymerase theta
MEEPNLQTVPRTRAFSVPATQAAAARRMHDANIRDAFVAPAGRLLLSADYKQMELRLMAHFSGDPLLIGMLSEADRDPFRLWAGQWLAIPAEQVCWVLLVEQFLKADA